MVEGPAGIGKTRLLASTCRSAAERQLTVLRARGGELEQHTPYGLVRELFAGPLAQAGRDELLTGAAALAAPVVAGSGEVVAPAGAAPTGCTGSPSTWPTARPWCWPSTTCSGPTRRRCASWAISPGDSTASRCCWYWPPAPRSSTATGRRSRRCSTTRSPRCSGPPRSRKPRPPRSCGRRSRPAPTTSCATSAARRPVATPCCCGCSPGRCMTTASRRRPPCPGWPSSRRRSWRRPCCRGCAGCPAEATTFAGAVAVLGDGAPLRYAAALAELDHGAAARAARRRAAGGGLIAEHGDRPRERRRSGGQPAQPRQHGRRHDLRRELGDPGRGGLRRHAVVVEGAGEHPQQEGAAGRRAALVAQLVVGAGRQAAAQPRPRALRERGGPEHSSGSWSNAATARRSPSDSSVPHSTSRTGRPSSRRAR